MEASTICAQQPTGKFPVPQVRCRSDEPPGGLQHRLQVWETLHPGHVRLLPWEGTTIQPQQVSKEAGKITKYLPRLPRDFLPACVRQDACQIALDSSVFPWHAPRESQGYSTCYTQLYRAWKPKRAYSD